MKIADMASAEIRYRRWSFVHTVLSLAVAAGTLVGSWSLLERHDAETRAVLDRKQAEREATVTALRDDMRRFMLHLGFDVTILPKDQDLGDWYADSYAAKTMPENLIHRLAAGGPVTVQHALPRLRRKTTWPERDWTVVAVGTGADAVRATAESTEIAVEHVSPGSVWVGFEIHRALGIAVADRISFHGRDFQVERCVDERGTADDITLWFDLGEVQRVFGLEGQINEIVALQCRASFREIERIREEIERILPETQVVEQSREATTKLEAIRHIEEEGEAALAAERGERAQLRRVRRATATGATGLLTVLATLWIGVTGTLDMRRRRRELSVLSALGFNPGQLAALLACRGALAAAVGGFGGFILGTVVAPMLAGAPDGSIIPAAGTMPGLKLVAALALTAAVVAAASVLPLFRAVKADPVRALRDD